ncbi:MAG: hypothetical protein AAGD25_08775 [Cyanobacteria bacterium P01_F01_bin.150]
MQDQIEQILRRVVSNAGSNRTNPFKTQNKSTGASSDSTANCCDRSSLKTPNEQISDPIMAIATANNHTKNLP